MRKKFYQGFTLIEIIIVIVIIGVLATLALPRITGQIETARAAEAMSMFGAIRRSVINCIDIGNGTGTAAGANAASANCLTWLDLGMSAPAADAQFLYTSSTNAAGTMQFRAIKGANSICLNFAASTGQGMYSISPNTRANPYYGPVMQTMTVGGAGCGVAALGAM